MTTSFFQPSTISIVHAAEHDRVRAELDLPPRLHGRRSVRDEHGPIVWKSKLRETDEYIRRSRDRSYGRVVKPPAHRKSQVQGSES